MGNKYLKTWVYTAIASMFVILLITLTVGVTKKIYKSVTTPEPTYVVENIADSYIPVNSEVEVKLIKQPFNDETVKEMVGFYDSKSSKEVQEKSILVYENTYMPNTGIMYKSEISFDVVAIYEGIVTNIKKDDVFGTIVEIKHDNNLVSRYSSLISENINMGDHVQAGEVIGTSGKNKITTKSENVLLFELIHNGEYVNPNNYYNKKLGELN